MEFPTIDKFAKEVAEKALDEITYEGKTIREWAEIIVKQQPSEDVEVIRVSKGALKSRQGRFVIYDVEWLKKNFYTTEEKLYGQPKQPCEDCISRQRVLNDLENVTKGSEHPRQAFVFVDECVDYIMSVPSVTPQPKTGHWIDIMVGDMQAQACDQCNTFYPLSYTGGGHKYCPNCGAKMEVDEDDNEDT